MKAKTNISDVPLEVVSIAWPRFASSPVPQAMRTTMTVVSRAIPFTFFEDELIVTDHNLNNFLMLDESFDSRAIVLMWKPLADAGIWGELHERDPAAIEIMRKLLLKIESDN